MAKTMVVTTKTLGSGNPQLGALLMTSFLMNLAEAEELPESVVLLNEGVELACIGSAALDFLKRLEARGVAISSCKTCVEYLDVEDRLGVGSIGTMHATVADILGQGDTVFIG